VKPTRRYTQKPQDRSQRDAVARAIDRAEDPQLGVSFRQTLSCERKAGGFYEGQSEPQQRRKLLDAFPQLQDLLPEFRLREIRHIQTNHARRRRAEPPTRRGARNAEIRGDGQVAGALDEFPEAMVIALLRAGRDRHADDHRPFTLAAQLLEGGVGRQSA
jgi:hypothetical protein